MFTIEFKKSHRRSWSATLSKRSVVGSSIEVTFMGEGKSHADDDSYVPILKALEDLFADPRTEGVLQGLDVEDIYLIAHSGGGILRLDGAWLRVGNPFLETFVVDTPAL